MYKEFNRRQKLLLELWSKWLEQGSYVVNVHTNEMYIVVFVYDIKNIFISRLDCFEGKNVTEDHKDYIHIGKPYYITRIEEAIEKFMYYSDSKTDKKLRRKVTNLMSRLDNDIQNYPKMWTRNQYVTERPAYLQKTAIMILQYIKDYGAVYPDRPIL